MPGADQMVDRLRRAGGPMFRLMDELHVDQSSETPMVSIALPSGLLRASPGVVLESVQPTLVSPAEIDAAMRQLPGIPVRQIRAALNAAAMARAVNDQ